MEFLIILLLLVLNGIFAMYEIALVSSSKARLETLVAKGNKSARGFLKQLEEPEKVLIYHSDRYYADRYRIRCVWWCGYCRRPRSFLFPHSGRRNVLHATWQ